MFVFDADGNPVDDAQLFDQDGRPLNLVGMRDQELVYSEDGDSVIVPSDATPGRAGWNVYPLATVATSRLGNDGLPLPGAVRTTPEFPFLVATPLRDVAAPESNDVDGAGERSPGD